MKEIKVDELVQLTQDMPELGLHRGEMGRVCSTWFAPTTTYEVEFQREMPNCSIRAMLMFKQLSVNGSCRTEIH
jgi:Domain of unknown function (DUF4926)